MKLVKWCVELLTVPPVVIDGALYVLIAIFGAMQAILTSDECYKYMNPYWIFGLKAFAGIGLAGAGALKMFRSNTYSEHLAAKEKANQTTDTRTISETTIVEHTPTSGIDPKDTAPKTDKSSP